MSEEEFEADDAELEEEEPDEEVLDEDDALDDDLDTDLVADDPDLVVEADIVEGEVVPVPAAAPAVAPAAETEEEEDVLDLDEELHPDDVEAPLDALLQERTAKATLEDEEEEVEEEG